MAESLQALRDDIDLVRGQFARLLGDPMIASAFDGTRRIPFNTVWKDPNDSTRQRVLVEDASGFARFVNAPAASSQWAQTSNGFLVPGDLTIGTGNVLNWGQLLIRVLQAGEDVSDVEVGGIVSSAQVPTMVVDGNALFTGGQLDVGRHDGKAGLIRLYGATTRGGSGSRSSPQLRYYLPGDEDSVFNFIQTWAALSGSTYFYQWDWVPSAGVGVTIANLSYVPDSIARFSLGIDDDTHGEVRLRGDGTGSDTGGVVAFELAADYDGTFNNFFAGAFQDDFIIYRNAPTTILFKVRGDTGAVEFNSASFGTPGTIQPDASASAGSAATFSRSDHRHAIAAAAASTITPDLANAEGTSTSFARADHIHNLAAATPGDAAFGDSALEGTSSSFARADHQHGMPDNPIPSGLIAMWHGTIASIPSGWVICDGNNGTPNLLSKFVIGVATAATNPGTTGGATTHTHGSDGGHTHDSHVNETQPYTGGSGFTPLGTPTTHSSDGAHTHDSQSNLPPYYAVAYIMKT